MKLRNGLITAFCLCSLLLQACGNAQAAIATGIFQTQQISSLQTAAAGNGNAAPAEQATADPGQPTNTLPPETATPGIPMVSVSQNTNCRSGPRVDYTLLTTINVGQEVEVLKVSPLSDYVVVRNPNASGDCWLYLQYANTTDFSSFGLQQATLPPTPTSTNTPKPTVQPVPEYWNGTWTAIFSGVTMTITIDQNNAQFSGSGPISNGGTITLSAQVSADGKTATGNFSWNTSPTGTFTWNLKPSMTQFNGEWKYDGTTTHGPWCGYLSGGSC